MTEPKEGSHTPWGTADYACRLGPGMVLVTTPSHGGIWLSSERLKQVPEAAKDYARKWSRSAAWYEEDIAACIPVILWPREVLPAIVREERGGAVATAWKALETFAPEVAEALREQQAQTALL